MIEEFNTERTLEIKIKIHGFWEHHPGNQYTEPTDEDIEISAFVGDVRLPVSLIKFLKLEEEAISRMKGEEE